MDPVIRTGIDLQFGSAGRRGVNLDVQRIYTSPFDPSDETNDYNAVHYGAALSLRF